MLGSYRSEDESFGRCRCCLPKPNGVSFSLVLPTSRGIARLHILR
jgi:hypothetical protein